MTPKEISERLVDLHAKLVDKIEEQPFVAPTMRVEGGEEASITLYRAYKTSGGYNLGTVKSGSFAGCLDAAEKFIADIPSKSELDKRDLQKDLAKVIDKAASVGVPVDVMTMLRGGMDALTENLLTYEGAD